VVAVALDPKEIPAVGERLAEAFDAAPGCDMLDRAWRARVTDLLLDAEDAAMLPLPGRPETAVPVEPTAALAMPFAADDPMLLSIPARRHVTFATICAIVVAIIGIGGAAAYLVTEQPADAPMVAASTVTLPPVMAPAPDAARASPAAPTPAPAAEAQASIPIEPPPAPQPTPAATASAAAPPAVSLSAMPAIAPSPTPTAGPPQPAPVAEAAPPPPSAPPDIAMPRPEKVAPPKMAKTPPKPVRKDVAAAKPAPSQARPATKRVAALEPRPKSDAAGPWDDAPAAPRPAFRPAPLPTSAAASGPLQPLDADELPPLEGSSGSSAPPMSDASAGTPVPLAAPFTRETPALGMPVSLLPPVGPPADMPSAPAGPR
jgi:hypothetical protein